MKKIKSIFNRQTLLYLIFGILTTIVNYAVFFLFYNVLFSGKNSIYANAVAFIVAVIFAFLVNKLYVFESKSWSPSVLKKEIPSFFVARIGSFLIEELGLFIAEKILKWNDFDVITIYNIVIDGITIVKLTLAVFVIILNYIFCKIVVFKGHNSK